MEYLKEIITKIGRNRVKHIEVIGNEKNKEQKLSQLYEGILNGNFNSDIQACNEIYGSSDLDQGYRNLKSRLEKKVLNTLFFVDLKNTPLKKFQKNHLQVYKNFSASKVLLLLGARKANVQLAKKTLTMALKYDLYDIAIILIKDLRMFYGALVGDLKELEKYNHLLNRLQQDLFYMHRAQEMYLNLCSQFVHSKTVKPQHLVDASKYAVELETYVDKTDYDTFHFYAHCIFVLKSQIENNHQATIQACQRALDHMSKNKNYHEIKIFSFLFQKFNSELHIKDFTAAEKGIQKAFELVKEGSINWWLTAQIKIILLLHTQKYQAAFNLFQEVNKVRKKRNTAKIAGVEFWRLIEGFIAFFIKTGKVEVSAVAKYTRFNHRNFLNLRLAQDKEGLNVTIVVLQFLFLLHDKKYNAIIDKMEALKTYELRYLRKKDATFRNSCFIKMLIKIPAANFNRIAVERHTKSLFDKLKSKPLELTAQPLEMEIVPYEDLWEMILDALDRTPRNKRLVKNKIG